MSNEKSKPTNAKGTHNYQDQLIKNEHTHTHKYLKIPKPHIGPFRKKNKKQ